MRILITGAGGFVGPHLLEAFSQILGEDAKIISTALHPGRHPILGNMESLDVTNAEAVNDAIIRHRPNHIFHLARIASPAAASTAAGEQMAWYAHLEGDAECRSCNS